MSNKLFCTLLVASLMALAVAECPNACSAHGKCGAYDMCTCYRNWMSNDCSERVCQFGAAHVDTPKGDLDASGGKLSGPGTTVIVNDAVYPMGTQEQFPSMMNSDDTVLTNTAHSYYECSNKGICDRATGTCACFDGYDGSACQRQSCPTSSAGQCSGHGVCESIRTLADRDFENVYRLWDEEITMGCRCDGGYTGPDCSQKVCKYGADPLYYDDSANIRYSNFTYQIYTRGLTTLTGNYSLWFEDHTGEDWQTGPIDIAATCTEVTDALEALPNNVIPAGTVRCYQHPAYASTNTPIYNANIKIGGSASGTTRFTLAFPANPGYLKQININKYLDGSRATLYSAETGTSTLGWHIYANGFTGEDTDYVNDLCEGVTVTISDTGLNNIGRLIVSTAAQTKLLKKCLGDSNNDPTDNVDVYDWDYGNVAKTVPKRWYKNEASTNIAMAMPNPHLIKLVDNYEFSYTYSDEPDPQMYPYPITQLCASTSEYLAFSGATTGWCADRNRPGFFAVVYYDGSNFNIFSKIGYVANVYSTTNPFLVYTTTGYLQRVSPVSVAANEITRYNDDVTVTTTESTIKSYHTNVFHMMNTSVVDDSYFGQIDCETNPVATGFYANDCLNKDDIVFFLNTVPSATSFATNPIFQNMYRVKKVFTDAPVLSLTSSVAARQQIVLDFGVNAHYSYDNSATTSSAAFVYKFHPPTGYNYVGQCSNRGICDTTSGVCQCFNGYTGDNCGTIDALAA